MPFYRYGVPGADCVAHLNIRGKKPACCRMPRREYDRVLPGDMGCCSRMSVALCDAPGCDVPICEHHRTRHVAKGNVDFCPEHKHLAEVL